MGDEILFYVDPTAMALLELAKHVDRLAGLLAGASVAEPVARLELPPPERP